MSLANRTAIVTGGAQGIGKATAQTLLERGASVVIVDIDVEAGRETQDELAGKGEVVFVDGDVADEGDVKRAVEFAIDRFGSLDAVVNNAGIGKGKPVTELSLDEWRRVIDVNLTSVFLFAKFAAPHLRAGEGGAIVNIASTRALMSEPDTEAYAASKGGILAITHNLAISLGPAVRVNAICPGWIETSGWKKASKRKVPTLRDIDHDQHPAGRVGTPTDIARMVAYLLSDDAEFVTGQHFVIDGGMTRKMIYEH